jgi:hypothetical protein
MSWSVSLMLPLAAMAMGGDAPPETDTDSASERFARVLVTAYVCETLGFGVNYEGLADWGHAIAAQMESDGATPEAAMAHIRGDVRDARDRFHYLHGQTLVTAAAIDSGFAGMTEGYDAQYRFQKSFTDRCKDLAAAPDIGALFTAPEQRLTGAEFSHTITAMYRRRTGGR